jgi:hypothetical protein
MSQQDEEPKEIDMKNGQKLALILWLYPLLLFYKCLVANKTKHWALGDLQQSIDVYCDRYIYDGVTIVGSLQKLSAQHTSAHSRPHRV